MFPESWKPFFEKYPNITYEPGGQTRFERYLTAFVPQEYLDSPDWSDYDFAMNLSYRAHYWGGSVDSKRYAVGGVEFTIKANKD